MPAFLTALPIDYPSLISLIAAVGVGIAIGLNRDLADKVLGMRTLTLVAVGATAASLAGLHYADLDAHPDALSRVVQGVLQGVLTGIGFVGAGVILHDPDRQQVSGLTTAAAVWVTAALGIACALGAWTVVIGGTLVTIGALVGLRWIEDYFGTREPPEPKR
jgi:putative Mg2+ transporter-C (MgtC) family protein